MGLFGISYHERDLYLKEIEQYKILCNSLQRTIDRLHKTIETQNDNIKSSTRKIEEVNNKLNELTDSLELKNKEIKALTECNNILKSQNNDLSKSLTTEHNARINAEKLHKEAVLQLEILEEANKKREKEYYDFYYKRVMPSVICKKNIIIAGIVQSLLEPTMQVINALDHKDLEEDLYF